MTRTLDRTYRFSEDDVRNALCEWLRKRDIPQPKYIGDTPCTKWTRGLDGSQTVQWSEEDEPSF